MTEIPYTLTRGDEEIELTVEYSVTPIWRATRHEPESGGEIEEMTVRRDGKPFTLTSLEERDLEEWIYQHHDYDADGHNDYGY